MKTAFLTIFILLIAPLVMAFTFQIENNLDEKVFYSLFQQDHQVKEYPGPMLRAGGEVGAGETVDVATNCRPGVYFLYWRNNDNTVCQQKEIEVDSSVKDSTIVAVELNPVFLEIVIP
jgi:hypothetical protein